MDLIPVPPELTKIAAGRIFRNDLRDPIGGIVDGKLMVYADWRWREFLESQR
jgi:hypothetical protein